MTLAPDAAPLRELATPALVVDRGALEANIDRMAALARTRGVNVRPHAKTHKSPAIAALQMRAGAVGIAAATIAEAEALAAAGIGGLLLTSPFMGSDKFARVARLNRGAGIAAVVDHPAQVDGLRAALQPGDPPLALLIDVDVGMMRTGIADAKAGVDLARAIAAEPRLRFAGIQGFAGHAQHVIEAPERAAAAARAGEILASCAAALTQAGLPPDVITGSGTGTHGLDAAGPYNELQPGSYVFMDADYERLRHPAGEALSFAPSLFVLATVVSANRPGQVTVDAGTKALATNGPLPSRILGAGAGASYRFAGDEHGIVTLAPGTPPPPLGTRLLIGATHCDPTVNLHAGLHAFDGQALERWPICGRYGD